MLVVVFVVAMVLMVVLMVVRVTALRGLTHQQPLLAAICCTSHCLPHTSGHGDACLVQVISQCRLTIELQCCELLLLEI